jgi:DNA polymerase V
MQPLIALVDCNNFYVSCERVFRPDLIGKPVAVLSNNDGCIVTRSKEVKDLGVKMGVPLFQIQQLVNQHQIQLFSSNYTLYADLSSRVMSTLEEFAPQS